MSDSILKINNLNVTFPLFGGILQREVASVQAVKNLSIDIKEGKTIGIVGESGSGKTTIGRAILNALNETQGEITYKTENEEIDISISPVNKFLFIVSADLLTTRPDIQTTDSGFAFSTSLKKLLLFSVTHCVKP